MCRSALLLGISIFSTNIQAHSFGQVYNLPIPFPLYAWAASNVLLFSFLIIAYLSSVESPITQTQTRLISFRIPASLDHTSKITRWLGVISLVICITAGYVGNQNPYANISMTLFWIILLLALAYSSVLTGDLYRLLNPWKAIISLLPPNIRYGQWNYPRRLAYWPALAGYTTLVYLELFGPGTPRSLANMLVAYTLINLFGVWFIGSRCWFRYCEFLSVFFRLIGKMAPFRYNGDRRVELKWNLAVAESQNHVSLLLFILFILSSTAYDSLHKTAAWQNLFWVHFYDLALAPHYGSDRISAYSALIPLYDIWQKISLLASPLVYFGIYMLFISMSKRLSGYKDSTLKFGQEFAYSLIPIAVVYHIAHYYTLVYSQGIKTIRLISDPLGKGWDIFGTAGLLRGSIIPDPAIVWHVQVGLIILGHLISVWIAHRVAMNIFDSTRKIIVSQLPILTLMILFTIFGLWVLAEPMKIQ